ncbi:hypothetical protein EVB78_063 [Rhizobium phage RHph_N1_15]|nr:hypothetical protein EVB77_062 [Rhizobium phage RHph_N1_10]QIG69265.1 hypothetical protein EVB78_063 [Rhizobium phage RHph_N1_15]QIG75125.1 hypothetical protein EVC15_063 [Rhizobium phage RHph_N2_6]
MWHRDWKKILFKANSMKWIAGATVLSIIEVYCQVFGPPAFVPPGLFAGLAGVTTVFAGIFRMRAQKEFQDADQ